MSKLCTRFALFQNGSFFISTLLSSEILRSLKNIEIFFRSWVLEISISKSLVSNTRAAFEFEKKFYVNRGSFDYSPVSMRALVEFD